VDLSHGVVDVDVGDLLGAGQQRAGLANPASSRAATASSWRTWPKVNERRNVPSVDGALAPSNNRPIAPCRSRSMSWIESAPATIPATSAGTFRYAFTPPAARKVRVSAARLCRPQRSASASTGASPAHDTKFGSSKLADSPAAA